MSWSRNHAASITKCYSLHTTQIKQRCFLHSFQYLVQCCCHFLASFLGGTHLTLLIVITLNRAIMISLSWYRNHHKYLPIQNMIPVINTSDKRINKEIFQNHQPWPCACLSFERSLWPIGDMTIISFSPSFALSSTSTVAHKLQCLHQTTYNCKTILNIHLWCFANKLDLLRQPRGENEAFQIK